MVLSILKVKVTAVTCRPTGMEFRSHLMRVAMSGSPSTTSGVFVPKLLFTDLLVM